jgi:YidC/Oxa1 family membrane protein insertase
MDFFQTILWPLQWVVELILVVWHEIWTWLGLDPTGGLNWVLSIAGLVVIIRGALIPVFVRQIKAQRRMLELAPDLKKIQEKYKGKKDQFSREAMSRESMALYKKHGTNPFSSCLPILIQMPIFFSLFYVLRTASDNNPGVGLMSAELAANFSQATVFGAPLSMTFLQAWERGIQDNWQVIVIATLLVIAMTASQFFTQLQIMSKNVSEETKNSPMFKQQRILLYVIPFMFVFSGVAFPLGLNFYWFSSNIWTMVQQFIVIRQMPTPGSEAFRMREERLARKKKGFKAAEIEEEPPAPEEIPRQRQQPVGKKRAKKKPSNPSGKNPSGKK